MKNAKKSMFITTILMVAVLIVAVSTATFAWYTTTTQVTASEAVVKSATSDSANIAIGWTNAATTTSISLDGTTDAVLPMIPTAKIAKEATGITFTTAPMNTENKFTADGTGANAWVITNAEESNNKFYVINHNINEGVTVKMTATFATGTDVDLSANLCVAVLVDGKVAGVFANNAYNYGTITMNNGDSSLSIANEAGDIVAPSTGITFDLGAKAEGSTNSAAISVYAWINGVQLTSANAGKSVATFSFNFAEDTTV